MCNDWMNTFMEKKLSTDQRLKIDLIRALKEKPRGGIRVAGGGIEMRLTEWEKSEMGPTRNRWVARWNVETVGNQAARTFDGDLRGGYENRDSENLESAKENLRQMPSSWRGKCKKNIFPPESGNCARPIFLCVSDGYHQRGVQRTIAKWLQMIWLW